MPDTVTAYIWTRESNIHDAEKYSIKSQLDACREAALADGVEVAREFQVQFSGRDLWAIPELTELRELIKRGDGPKRIYCYTQDRLVRGEEAFDIFYLLVEFRRAGAEVRFIRNPVDLKNIAGQIMTLVAGHEASGEIEKIKDRTMRGRRKRAEEGKVWGAGRDLYGYRKDREAGIVTIHEPEAEIVRRIFRESLDGLSLGAIARGLDAGGVASPFKAKNQRRAGLWWPTSVRDILINPAYKGEAIAFRHSGRGAEAWVKMPDGLFPPLVSADDWERAQERLKINRGEKARNQRQPALLRGLAFCGKCGKRLYYIGKYEKLRSGEQKLWFYYRCSSGWKGRKGLRPCGASHARADRIEAEVWARVVASLRDPDGLIQAVGLALDRDGGDQLNARRASLLKEIERRENEATRLARRLREADDRIAGLIQSEMLAVDDERGKLLASLAEVEAALVEQRNIEINIERIKTFCRELGREAREDASFEQRRRTLEALQVRVRADGRHWEIEGAGLVSAEGVLNKIAIVLARSDE